MEVTGTSILENLFPELIIKILHCCECFSILRFAATYYELVMQSISLQLHIELEANGVEIVKGSLKPDASYSVVLEDLRRFRDAWLNLDIGEPIMRSLGESEMLLWELREGFYIKAISQSGGRYANSLQFIPLDAESPDPLPLLFDFVFNEFTADPGQDLVALISRDPDRNNTCHIHLHSSTTGSSHPLAQHPRLTAEFDFTFPLFASCYAIEIMGHALIAKISRPEADTYELLIWDWRSGIVLHRISSRTGLCDFSFLDLQHLVVLSVTRSSPSQDTISLLIYTLSESPSTGCAAYNRKLRATDVPISEPTLCLEFPRPREWSKISNSGLLLRSDPTPGRTIYTKSAAFVCPYTITLGITLVFRSSRVNWDSPPSYRIFLDGLSLLDLIRTYSCDGVTVAPWSMWGINATRWFVAPEQPDHWICWMSGSRYVRPLLECPYYCVFDFSSLSARRFQGGPSPASHNVDSSADTSSLAVSEVFGDLEQLDNHLLSLLESALPSSGGRTQPVVVNVGVDNPSVIGIGDFPEFNEPIVSRLPYRIVCKGDNQLDPEGWQINNNCLVGVVDWFGSPSESITIYKLNE
ncbi:unnamed protein product [Rhizoctonia solani]|uniref:F-box domain-containing protein n=1 Tax=Rhizoctonia solani TaxID=456999 RepID=A0A8H3HWW2_9AGAM|nr:unnamed protein product [Rhizoctonia solani]